MGSFQRPISGITEGDPGGRALLASLSKLSDVHLRQWSLFAHLSAS